MAQLSPSLFFEILHTHDFFAQKLTKRFPDTITIYAVPNLQQIKKKFLVKQILGYGPLLFPDTIC